MIHLISLSLMQTQAKIIKESTYDDKVTKNINLDGIPEPKISQVSNTNRNPKLVEEAPVEE